MATVLVTGANGSIGCELVKLFLKRGDKVVAVCRHQTDLLEAAKSELKNAQVLKEEHLHIVKGLELDKPSTLSAFVQQMPTFGKPFDLVVMNAGVLFPDDGAAKLPDLAADKISESLTTNAVSPLLLTAELLQRKLITAPNGKVALVTSRMGSVDDNGSGGYYGYRMSKCALNMAGKCLAIDLKPQGIAVGLLHPGYVKTKMTNWQGHIDAAESARLLALRIDGDLSLETSGGFWHCNGEKLPW